MSHAGPYIVTTKRPCTTTADSCHGDPEIEACICGGRVSRWAVATLEVATAEAERAVRRWRDEDGSRTAWDAAYSPLSAVANLPESGGSVGPLPDGTVIEVEPTTYHALWQATSWGQRGGAYFDTDGSDNIAAYNAAQVEGLMS